ncbi:hypothetical protein GCM10020221_24860 [Streptomyces thioluteus]|uniref:Integral membrane protein n=1 Tax=Streptomyces thioluteus TaxID=66431 RepID=A0ABP6JBL3_STRTU
MESDARREQAIYAAGVWVLGGGVCVVAAAFFMERVCKLPEDEDEGTTPPTGSAGVGVFSPPRPNPVCAGAAPLRDPVGDAVRAGHALRAVGGASPLHTTGGLRTLGPPAGIAPPHVGVAPVAERGFAAGPARASESALGCCPRITGNITPRTGSISPSGV